LVTYLKKANTLSKESKMELKKINEFAWQIDKQGPMKVPAVIYASEKLLEKIKQDKTLEQAKNVACLKGIQRASYAMPDAHQGYGFPIGGVAAFDMEEGIISPGGVGYDINCGVRLLRTNLKVNDVLSKRKQLLEELYKEVPAGVGKGGITKVTKGTLKEVLSKGAKWAVEQGYGTADDLQKTEEYGNMKADAHDVSERALQRGIPQLGTLGAGNHFLEMQKVDKIFDKKTAKAFGIEEQGQITVMIHCGSRGLGHQVASDYIKKMEEKYGTKNLPDRELINAPISSDLGQKYYNAMRASVNFAFANRQMIAHWTRDVFKKIFGSSDGMSQVYDVCHNLAKFEKHNIGGQEKEVCVHRKGATRSFGPGRKEIPEIYRNIGQPVLIPGSMGTASYLLVGTKKAEEISFGSTAHGAGRVMSRHDAIRNYRGEQVKKDLETKDIIVRGSWKGLAEETWQAYKDIDEVVKTSHKLGIGNLVAKLVPVAVMKG
jgi:tRNA-splicing ligase RtcB